jgi:hypothetical protein
MLLIFTTSQKILGLNLLACDCPSIVFDIIITTWNSDPVTAAQQQLQQELQQQLQQQ